MDQTPSVSPGSPLRCFLKLQQNNNKNLRPAKIFFCFFPKIYPEFPACVRCPLYGKPIFKGPNIIFVMLQKSSKKRGIHLIAHTKIAHSDEMFKPELQFLPSGPAVPHIFKSTTGTKTRPMSTNFSLAGFAMLKWSMLHKYSAKYSSCVRDHRAPLSHNKNYVADACAGKSYVAAVMPAAAAAPSASGVPARLS